MRHRAKIKLPKASIEDFCKQHGIRRLALFGSVLRDDFGPASDVDVLVEFESGRKVGLLKMAHLENQLSTILGRKADLRTPEDLSRYFRQAVLDSAETHYAK